MTAAAQCAGALATVAFLAAGWLILGWRLLRGVRADLPPSERLALALLAGAGVEGVVLFVVGQLHFSALVVLVVTAAALAPATSAAERRDLRETLAQLGHPPAAMLAVLVPLFALMALAGLAHPLGGMGADGISYHLAGPHYWLVHHRILPVPDAATTAFPVAVESLFGAAMALAGDRAPGLVGAVMTLAVTMQVFGLARWLGAGPGWAMLASVLVACMPAVVIHGQSAFVDIEYAAFALAAFRLLFSDETERAAAGPLFLGLCLATKYNGLTLVPITLGLAGLRQARRAGVARAANVVARGALISAAFALPFLLRNWLMLGAPIYPPPPALARLWPAKGFSYSASVALQHYVTIERGAGLGRRLTDFLLLPWRFTLHTSDFHGAGGVGIAPLALFPAAVMARWNDLLRWSLAWLLLNTFVWFVVQQEARFLVPFVILATAISVAGGEALARDFPRIGRVVVATLVAISVGYGGAVLAGDLARHARTVVSPSSAARAWHDEVPFADVYTYLNALPRPCRVLILSPHVPPYYLEQDYVKVRGMFQEETVPGVTDAATALARLDELQITHVFDVTIGAPYSAPFEIPMPPTGRLALVFQTANARVFAVAPTGVPANR